MAISAAAGTPVSTIAYAVNNRSFRDWRTATGRGGDFVLFSDVAVIALPRPIRLELAL